MSKEALLGTHFVLPVLAEDIEKGEKGNCHWCPYALALKRYLSRFEKREDIGVSVRMSGATAIFFNAEGEFKIRRYTFSKITKKRIEDFDRAKPGSHAGMVPHNARLYRIS